MSLLKLVLINSLLFITIFMSGCLGATPDVRVVKEEVVVEVKIPTAHLIDIPPPVELECSILEQSILKDEIRIDKDLSLPELAKCLMIDLYGVTIRMNELEHKIIDNNKIANNAGNIETK